MKKFIFAIIFTINFNFLFSYNIDDYLIFSQGKIFYEDGNYSDANFKFQTLERSFKKSPLILSKYSNFYTALNFYKMGDIDNAITYMERAVYTPKSLQGKNLFSLDRSYYLGKFYYEQGKFSQAIPYLEQLVNKDFSPKGIQYELYALERLKEKNEKFNIIYNIKFKNDFSNLDSLSFEDLLLSANYFTNKESYSNSITILEYLHEKDPQNLKVIEEYLKTLYLNKNYDDIITLSEKIQNFNNNPIIFYYRGLAFLAKKSFIYGIINLEKVVKNIPSNSRLPYVKDARERIINTYYLLKNFNEVIEYETALSNLSSKEKFLLINSLFLNGNYDMGLKKANEFSNEFVFSIEDLHFKRLINIANNVPPEELTKIIKNTYESPSLKLSTLLIHNYISALKKYPSTNLEEVLNNNPNSQKLFSIAQLEDLELLTLELENTSNISYDKTINGFIKTKLFEKSKNYKEAFSSSQKNSDMFSKYSNLLPLLYPRYYSDEVKIASKKYDIPEDLIYTVIYLSSNFNYKYSKHHEKVGLMQIKYLPGDDFNSLINPETNIDLGTKKLKKLIKKYDSKIKGVIHYLYGEEALNNIYFENEDFYFYRISDLTLKEKLLQFSQTYLFYKVLYN